MKMRRGWMVAGMMLGATLWLPGQGQAGSESVQPKVPDSYRERVKQEGNYLELTLKDAVRLALLNNLEIAIEDYNEDLNRERLVQTKGFYDPVLKFTVGVNSFSSPITNVLTAGTGVSSFSQKRFTWNSGVTQNIPWGGTLQVQLNNDRTANNNTFQTINPQFTSDFSINFTQPLWRGFRRTQTDRQLRLVNLDQKISDSQFKQRVADIIQQVEDQYWELLFTIENHEARRQSMQLALVQFQDNTKRVRIGVLAPIEITSARAEVSTREQDMIQAEVQIVQAQNALKRLLASDPKDSLWSLKLLPTDRPRVKDVKIGVTLEQAIQTALKNRPEIEQLRLQLEKSGVDERYYRRATKPAVNLRANFGSTGRAGLAFRAIPVDLNGDGIPDSQKRIPDPSNPLFGNLVDSLGQTFGFGFRNWGIFADVEIPIFNRSSRAQLAQAKIDQARLLSQMKNQQQLVIVDVRNAYESLEIQQKRLEAANVARQLTQEQLDGENKRFEAGLSTSFEVLRFQRDLTQAQSQVLRAALDYQKALTALDKAMYTIIEESDVVLAKARK